MAMAISFIALSLVSSFLGAAAIASVNFGDVIVYTMLWFFGQMAGIPGTSSPVHLNFFCALMSLGDCLAIVSANPKM